jgi:hypothetical protein
LIEPAPPFPTGGAFFDELAKSIFPLPCGSEDEPLYSIFPLPCGSEDEPLYSIFPLPLWEGMKGRGKEKETLAGSLYCRRQKRAA